MFAADTSLPMKEKDLEFSDSLNDGSDFIKWV